MINVQTVPSRGEMEAWKKSKCSRLMGIEIPRSSAHCATEYLKRCSGVLCLSFSSVAPQSTFANENQFVSDALSASSFAA
jgi:hypothetical protein